MADLKENHELQDIAATDNSINADDDKVKVVNVDNSSHEEKGSVHQMRTKADDLPIWESVKRYKLVSLLAMVAAFSASLDGYRKPFPTNLVGSHT